MKRSTLIFALTTIFTGIIYSCTMNAEEVNLKPSNALIVELESRIKMPSKAFPLNTYIRYYAFDESKGHRVILGEYIHDPVNAGIRLVRKDEVPKIMDGGCAVINIKYDLEEKNILNIFCNGDA